MSPPQEQPVHPLHGKLALPPEERLHHQRHKVHGVHVVVVPAAVHDWQEIKQLRHPDNLPDRTVRVEMRNFSRFVEHVIVSKDLRAKGLDGKALKAQLNTRPDLSAPIEDFLAPLLKGTE